jgi:mono/diheme cytochrome c family protein
MTVKTGLLVIVIAIALIALSIPAAGARTNALPTFDATKTYKAKCVSCHGAKAEKKFDVTKSDDENVNSILKGKKATKPPNMPGYESKGITADQAKALLDHMKSLRQ